MRRITEVISDPATILFISCTQGLLNQFFSNNMPCEEGQDIEVQEKQYGEVYEEYTKTELLVTTDEESDSTILKPMLIIKKNINDFMNEMVPGNEEYIGKTDYEEMVMDKPSSAETVCNETNNVQEEKVSVTNIIHKENVSELEPIIETVEHGSTNSKEQAEGKSDEIKEIEEEELGKEDDDKQNLEKEESLTTEQSPIENENREGEINELLQNDDCKLTIDESSPSEAKSGSMSAIFSIKDTKKVLVQNVVNIGTINVRLQNLMCLNDKEWLYEEIIDALNVLVSEYQRENTTLSTKVHLFPTLFLSNYEKFGYIRVRGYMKQINIWQMGN
jgi:Ulp1 family protease